MISYRFSYFDRFSILVQSPFRCAVTEYFVAELGGLLDSAEDKVVGVVALVDRIPIPADAVIMAHDTTYATSERLFYRYLGAVVAVKAEGTRFEITAETGADPFLVFYVTECLVRTYAVQYGIVFLHASAFVWNGCGFVVNAFGGVGKTNLLLDVLEDGGVYLADDLAPVDEEGNVYPYPKRVNLLHYNFEYKPKLLSVAGRSPAWLKVLRLCTWTKRTGFFYRAFIHKVEWRVKSRLNVRLTCSQLCGKRPLAEPAQVDQFVWLERSRTRTDVERVSAPYVSSRIRLCLRRESGYFDGLADCLAAVFPHLADLTSRQDQLVERAVGRNDCVGVRKGPGDNKGLFDLVSAL